ncbi:MAG TPA: hypothetical protein VHE83_04995, partial [Mycobacteriales bacterium]|nr:hypothetical protein [Mycobacteriales bacterium]
RALAAVEGPPRRADRRHALHVQAVNARGLALPFVLLVVVIGGLLRALGDLLTRRPHHARDEIDAVRSLLAGFGRVLRGRSWRSDQRRGDRAGVRALLPPPGARLRSRIGAASDLLVSSGEIEDRVVRLETGPSEEDEDDLLGDDTSRLRALLLRPGLLVPLGLLVVTLVAARHLIGSGVLFGGRLLPAPKGASDLWASWFATWHPGPAGGTAAPAAPWTPWLALLSTITLGRPGLALDVLLIGAAPLAGLAAWRASRAFIDNAALRAWVAVSWATMPVLTGAVAGGHFDTCVVVVLLPGLLVAGARVVGTDPARGGWRRAWSMGLALAIAAAFSPQAWTAAALLLLGGWALVTAAGVTDVAGTARRLRAVAIALVVPGVLALPYLPHLLGSPTVLITGLGRGAGIGGLTPSATAGPVALGLLHPGGTGLPPAVFTAPLVLAAILALGRVDIDRRRAAALLWLLGISGIGAALVVSRIHVAGIGGVGRAWPGTPMAIGAAGMLGAAAISAEHLRDRLAATAFGWRQLVSTLLAGACLAAPAATGIWWIARGAQGPLHRADDVLLPPDVVADATAHHDSGQRVLVLRRTDTGIHYDLRGLAGPRLGDEELPGGKTARHLLGLVVRDLATNRGTDAAQVLATFDVRVVVVPGDARTNLTDALDAQPALARRETPFAAGIWTVEATVPTGRLQLLAPALAAQATAPAVATAGAGRGPAIPDLVANPPQIVASGREGAHADIPAGPGGRLLVLAEAANGGWRARIDGHPLKRRTAWGWAQAFEVPAGGGHLVISRDASGHDALVVLAIIGLLVVLVLAAPSAGSDAETLDDVAPDDEPEPEPAPAPAGSATLRLRRGPKHTATSAPAADDVLPSDAVAPGEEEG